jgi:hypothetical protein
LCFESEFTISGTEVANYPFYSIGSKIMLGVIRSISLTFGMKKGAKLVLQDSMHYFGVPNL